MRILIVGAGATGSLFGARLARAGATVVLLGRPDHVAAIRRAGLVVEGVEPGTVALEATSTLGPGLRADAALVTVKSFDLAVAAYELGRAVPPIPTVLLGNGLGIEDVTRQALARAGWRNPEEWVVRAIHTVPATFLGPGRVRASGTGEVVFPEPKPGSRTGATVERLSDLFAAAGFAVRRSARFDLEVWRKVLVNAAINPVTALRRVPNGTLSSGEARAEAELLLDEALAVARRSGLEIGRSEAVADLERVVRATAENRSSMLQDVEQGRPTEIEAISGEILRRGRSFGLDLPETARVVAALSERAGRGRAAAQR